MDKKIITRAEAKALGLKRYFTGKPCKHEHISERFVSTHQCVKCIYDLSKKWHVENKDKVRDKNTRYRSENYEKVLEIGVKYRDKNREKLREKDAKYRVEKPDKAREKSSKYRAKSKAEYEALMAELHTENSGEEK